MTIVILSSLSNKNPLTLESLIITSKWIMIVITSLMIIVRMYSRFSLMSLMIFNINKNNRISVINRKKLKNKMLLLSNRKRLILLIKCGTLIKMISNKQGLINLNKYFQLLNLNKSKNNNKNKNNRYNRNKRKKMKYNLTISLIRVNKIQ